MIAEGALRRPFFFLPHHDVIPAQAGIHLKCGTMDPGLRRGDEYGRDDRAARKGVFYKAER
jgi:hypothetical protein